MEPSSPFANTAVPIIGQPQMIGASIVVTFTCPCEAKRAIHTMVGAPPAQCPACQKKWAVGAELKLGITQVVGGPVGPVVES